MSKRRNYEVLEPVDLPEEQDRRVTAAIEQADHDIEAARVNFRWGAAQVELVKRAASLAGVPYQTYLKQVVYRQAIADLTAARAIGLLPATLPDEP